MEKFDFPPFISKDWTKLIPALYASSGFRFFEKLKVRLLIIKERFSAKTLAVR